MEPHSPVQCDWPKNCICNPGRETQSLLMKFAIWLAGREPYIISSSGSQAPCMPQAPRGYLSYHREKTYLRIKPYREKQSQEVEETKT